MKKRILLYLLPFLFTGAFAQTAVIDSFIHDGIYRNYRLYVPAIYNSNTAVPLLLNLHGYTSNAVQQELYTNFKPVADTANFILIHPNGTQDGQGSQFWNAFGNSSVDDIGFLSALIDTISAQYNINPNRVYSTGMSNGGFMSYELACNLGNKIAAIASVTGTMITPNLANCNASHPTPVMQIHGTADATVPYNGGQGFTAIETLVDYWVEFNNCNPTPVITPVPNTNTTDGCTAEHYVYSGGDNGSTVEFYKVTGGGHSWPGAPININITNMDFSATREVWRFLSQYTLTGLTSVENTPAQKPLFSVFPNPTGGDVNLVFATQGPKQVSVYNATGQLVKGFATADTQYNLTIAQSGLYFVRVEQGAKVWTSRLIVN